MGIRINKYIGYGFDDLVTNDQRIDFSVFEDKLEAEKEEFDSYIQLVKTDDLEYSMYNMLKSKSWSLCEKAVYDEEFGLDNVILFSHPLHDDWHRYDNIIDYVDNIEGDIEESTVKRLSMGIYPYDSREKRYHIPSKELIDDRTITHHKYSGQELITSSGINIGKYEDFCNDLIPEVPLLIKHLAEFMGVKSAYINELRPLSYTYWS